jgi:hypothetical protein
VSKKNKNVEQPLVTQNQDEYDLLDNFRLMIANQEFSRQFHKSANTVGRIINRVRFDVVDDDDGVPF